jgi:hypothetical protein
MAVGQDLQIGAVRQEGVQLVSLAIEEVINTWVRIDYAVYQQPVLVDIRFSDVDRHAL